MNSSALPVLYLVPRPVFFDQHNGVNGAIGHIHGVFGGLHALGLEPELLCGDTQSALVNAGYRVHIVKQRNRLLFAATFLREVRELVRARRYKFIYLRYIIQFTPFIPLLKRIIGDIPLVMDVNMVMSDHYRALSPVDRFGLRACDAIITHHSQINDRLRTLLGPRHQRKLLTITNGVDMARFEGPGQDVVPRHKGAIHVGYTGRYYPDWGLEDLIEAQGLIARERDDIKTVLVSVQLDDFAAPLRQKVKETAGLYLSPPVPYDEISAIMKGFDLLVSPLPQDATIGLTTKLFEYMATKKPILTGLHFETQNIFKDGENVCFYEAGCARSLKEAICKLADDPVLRDRLAANAFLLAGEKHSWRAKMSKLVSFLERRV